MTTTGERLLTAEDLERMPDDGKLYELDEGRLIELCPANAVSSFAAARILIRVGSFVSAHKLGEVGGADLGINLARNPDTVRAPDVAFVSYARLHEKKLRRRGFLDAVPELVIEVLSPTDRYADVRRKVRQYLAAGVKQAWIFHPLDRWVEVFFDDGRVVEFGEHDVIDGGELLPGFRLVLDEIWEDVDEDEADENAGNPA